ncbi:unnamed protein product, partial [Rotaria sp. Silwood2]
NSEQTSSTLTADSVKVYLGEHPEFLDSYLHILDLKKFVFTSKRSSYRIH